MSQLFESYLAGQVACLMEFAPMFWPTINSYKRLVDGFWAPVKPTWGIDNRTASFRVIAGSPKATRLETRCPGADINPYLAMAAVIAAGLHGVEKGLKLTAPPITGTNQGAREHSAGAAHADRDHAQLQPVGDRARFPGRHLRRPFRRHPRLGMAPVAGRRDRLGIEALFRNHLSASGVSHGRTPTHTVRRSDRTSIMSITGFSFPTAIRFGPGARKEVAQHLREQGCKRPLIVTDKALARAAGAGRVQDPSRRAARWRCSRACSATRPAAR